VQRRIQRLLETDRWAFAARQYQVSQTSRFYTGKLDQVVWTGAWNPTPLMTVEFSGERNIGRLATGDFTQMLVGTRLRLNISPDLSVTSYAQDDTDSDSVGVTARVRWTFTPAADLFVVYNHNVRSLRDQWPLIRTSW
jgi:hypothetical protein